VVKQFWLNQSVEKWSVFLVCHWGVCHAYYCIIMLEADWWLIKQSELQIRQYSLLISEYTNISCKISSHKPAPVTFPCNFKRSVLKCYWFKSRWLSFIESFSPIILQFLYKATRNYPGVGRTRIKKSPNQLGRLANPDFTIIPKILLVYEGLRELVSLCQLVSLYITSLFIEVLFC
jgi:hypothetical protein